MNSPLVRIVKECTLINFKSRFVLGYSMHLTGQLGLLIRVIFDHLYGNRFIVYQ